MRNFLFFSVLFYSLALCCQTDYSSQWEDLFSYNNVKKIISDENKLYALTDNAVFTYNFKTSETTKISSVNGLSGGETSAIYYNETFKRLVIGYESGLIEVINSNGEITFSPDIVNFNQLGVKRINAIYEHNNKLYLATPFAIVVYDIEKLEFGDTYFIGAGSSSVNINEITVYNNIIYAATANGIYTANIQNSNLIDATHWNLQFAGNFQKIVHFKNTIYASSGNNLHQISGNSITPVLSFSEGIKNVQTSSENILISLAKKAIIYNASLTKIAEKTTTANFNFSLNTATMFNNTILLGTKEFGVLLGSVASQDYQEIHPEGPLENSTFSISAYNNNLWVVYGGYDGAYTPLGRRKGYSHFNGKNWINSSPQISNQLPDLLHISIDKTKENRVFISAAGDTDRANTMLTGGLLEVENDQIKTFYNQLNSPLEDIRANSPSPAVTIRISGTAFDADGNLWITNFGVEKRIKKLSPTGQWTGYDITEIYSGGLGMNELVVDNSNTKWIGTRNGGVYIFNENGNKKRALTTEVNKGNLPNQNVRTVAVDKNNRIWLGTLTGMVVYNNASNIFNEDIYNAEPIIIIDDGTPQKLLGDQTINSISVDGANNKWFGTENSGVLYTNPNGQKTLANFNTNNSPLPSNKITKIAVDNTTGKVYFATDKGIVAYNSKVAPFGEELGEVYAYPNPALQKHSTITIDGRNGKHLPKGTNIKILDVSGNLVYETNIVEGEQVQGGKAVWNKRNLAGKIVASGVYIVLLSTEDGTETSTTKIAIIR